VSFRLIVRLPGERGMPGYAECALASEAFAIYRRLVRTRLRVEEILDLRIGHCQPITEAELEAIAQRDRRRRHQAATDRDHADGGAS
jgi:hypothetical protein